MFNGFQKEPDYVVDCMLSLVKDIFHTKVKKKSTTLKVTFKKPLMLFTLHFKISLVNDNPYEKDIYCK